MKSAFSRIRRPFMTAVAAAALALPLLGAGADVLAQTPPAGSPVAKHGQLRVEGSKVLGAHGNPVQLRGMSLYWSNGSGARNFYNATTVKQLKDDWKANLVRAAMGVQATGEGWTWGPGQGGYLTDPTNKTRTIDVVEAAINEGIYVIIDWHTHAAQNNQSQAIEFFQEMATSYKDKPNVIYEIYNEPCPTTDAKCTGDNWASVVKPYAQAVVNAIREIDTKNLIIIGTPTWSQRVDQAANDPVAGEHLLYALHFYSGTHKAGVRTFATTAMSKNRAVFVSEFGTCDASGNGALDLTETDTWLKFLGDNNIGWANWSLSAQNESSAALKSGTSATANWTDDNFTQSGKYIRDKLIAAYVAEQNSTSTRPSAVSVAKASSWTVRQDGGKLYLRGPSSTVSAAVAFYDVRGKQAARASYSATSGAASAMITAKAIPSGNYIMVVRDKASNREVYRTRVSLAF